MVTPKKIRRAMTGRGSIHAVVSSIRLLVFDDGPQAEAQEVELVGDRLHGRQLFVEGTKNDRYASFGLLAFELSKNGGQAADIKTLSLRLVQSLPRIAKDGKVRFYLAEPLDGRGDPLSGLMFVPKSPSGVGKDAFKARHLLGSETFKKVETGHADTFEFRPDAAGQDYLRDRLKAGGTILIVAVPDDEEVAATYFGAGTEREGN
jgi:hypothetical protein